MKFLVHGRPWALKEHVEEEQQEEQEQQEEMLGELVIYPHELSGIGVDRVPKKKHMSFWMVFTRKDCGNFHG